MYVSGLFPPSFFLGHSGIGRRERIFHFLSAEIPTGIYLQKRVAHYVYASMNFPLLPVLPALLGEEEEEF